MEVCDGCRNEQDGKEGKFLRGGAEQATWRSFTDRGSDVCSLPSFAAVHAQIHFLAFMLSMLTAGTAEASGATAPQGMDSN